MSFFLDINRLKTELDKPLVVMFQWLMAKPNHIKKYAQLYIDQGFDVMSVSVTPWQVRILIRYSECFDINFNVTF